VGRAEHGKVQLGFFSFTEVTDPGAHRSYNEWHQLDHMPEQFPLDGIVYGQRWVSTPACRAARVTSTPPFDAVHYMTLYLLAAPIERSLRDFMELGTELRAAGRFHHQRRAHLSGPLHVQACAASPRVLVSAAAVPYRPNRGVYVVVEGPPNSEAGAEPSWGARHRATLLELPGVAGLWEFAASPDVPRYSWTTAGHRITVVWLDAEPLALNPVLAGLDAAERTVLSAPFETITPWQWDWFESR
jgi:hypothetical protein